MATWKLGVNKWANGIVPFAIDNSDDGFRQKVLNAANTFNDNVSREMWTYCPDLDVAKKQHANYVIIERTNGGKSEFNGCNANEGSQFLQVSGKTGVMLHEMMHVVGFEHEQVHPQFCLGLAPDAQELSNQALRAIREKNKFEIDNPTWKQLRSILKDYFISNLYFATYLLSVMRAYQSGLTAGYVQTCQKYLHVYTSDTTYPDWESIMYYLKFLEAAVEAGNKVDPPAELPGLLGITPSNYEDNATSLSRADARSVEFLYS